MCYAAADQRIKKQNIGLIYTPRGRTYTLTTFEKKWNPQFC